MSLLSYKKIVLLIALASLAFSCSKNDVPDLDLSEAGHSRILLAKGEEQQIQDLIDSDEIYGRKCI